VDAEGRANGSATGRLRLVVMIDRYPVLSETFVTGEVTALRRLGHEVRVEAIERPPAALRGDAPDGIPTHYLVDERRPAKLRDLTWLLTRHPLRAARDLLARRRWRREERVRPLRALGGRARRIHRFRTQHLHVHFATESALDALRIGRLLGLPYSVTAHGYDIFATPRNLPAKLDEASFVTSGCQYNVAHLRGLLEPAKASRVHEIVMGIDPARFARRTPHPSGRNVLAVGRLVEKKGFHVLIEAVAHDRARASIESVVIVGEGPWRAPLEQLIAREGLENVVKLPGAASPDRVRERLEAADLLAMPCLVAADGDRDSMPVVVKEALAMEVPVVASDEVGLPELVRPDWGRLAPPGDPGLLAQALAELLDLPPATRAAMGRAGRAWVVEHCDLARETARLAELMRPAGGQRAASTSR
jgi:colanic acid/amylovoran biosynthesis glycosyltransferase